VDIAFVDAISTIAYTDYTMKKIDLNKPATKGDIEDFKKDFSKKFATKDDLKKHPTKDDLRNELKKHPTKDDLKSELRKYPTKDDLKSELRKYPTKDDLRNELKKHPTKDDLRNELKKYATKDDLKLTEANLRYDMDEMKTIISDIKETTDKTYNLIDKHIMHHEDFDQELVIVKARVDRVEEKVGLRDTAL